MTIKVSGAAGIEFPDATVQATAATVVGLFSASPLAANVQLLGPNTDNDVKIVLGDVIANGDNWFNAGRYTPQIAGWYQFFGQIYYSGQNISVQAAHALVVKNGTEWGLAQFLGWYNGNGGSGQIVSCGGLIHMNGSTDFVELWGGCYCTNTSLVLYQSTRFSGSLLKAD